MATVIDMQMVQKILTNALKAADAVDNIALDDDTLGNKAKEAQVNRELLNLSDQLLLAAALVKNEYWATKGLMSYDL